MPRKRSDIGVQKRRKREAEEAKLTEAAELARARRKDAPSYRSRRG